MAVVEISKPHLEELVGEELGVEKLEEEGSMLGILFEDSTESGDSARSNGTSGSTSSEEDKIEVEVEPNRPDLLSVEGIARALRGFFEIETGAVDYPVETGDIEVEVDSSVKNVRKHIACARIKNLDLKEDELNSIIQLQEKLTETYGRKRKKIAIGLHDLGPLEPPITYRGADPSEDSFVPLGRDEEMNLGDILEEHDKGKKYGWILEDEERYPLLQDSEGEVLSMPPIINGELTEVDDDTDDIFLDVTGTSRREVETALNILVAALHERGGTIESVEVGGERMPDMTGDLREIDPEYVREVSGLDNLSEEGIKEQLEKMLYGVEIEGDKLLVTVPAYRADVMHPYDVIEDVVIGYGYGNVEEEIPEVSTIGGEDDRTVFRDSLRELMVGTGAQETMTFILSNREKLFDRMDKEKEEVVSMANPLTEEYTVVRNWVLPSLMEVLGNNQHNRYPQKLFEVGKVSELEDHSHTGADDSYQLAYVSAGSETGFSEVRGVLQSVAKELGLEFEVEELSHGSFRDKRCGNIVLDGEEAGIIGEINEEVRDSWGLDVSVAAFEIYVDVLQDAVK
ncbi:MAG: phenylalanine--tRNA ligase subunit beta [Candidatus Nanohaloarchaeota archaeon QJJ-7]|nr:phenylalanine--tRNA ligase subunit beta [Candidatus Nanohaloarchaeota archaeon QJJ-7]